MVKKLLKSFVRKINLSYAKDKKLNIFTTKKNYNIFSHNTVTIETSLHVKEIYNKLQVDLDDFLGKF